jgi:hypothetical protein
MFVVGVLSLAPSPVGMDCLRTNMIASGMSRVGRI